MIAIFLTAQHALADVPPPRVELDCPRGSHQTLQARRWTCAPNAACPGTADCGKAKKCEPVSLCIETGTVKVRSGITRDGSPNIVTRTFTNASALCGAAGGCDSGECSMVSRCVAAPAEPTPTEPTPADDVSSPQAAPEAAPPAGLCASAPGALGAGWLLAVAFGLRRRRLEPLS